MDEMLISIIVFLVVYAAITFELVNKAVAAFSGVAILMLLHVIDEHQAIEFIDFETIGELLLNSHSNSKININGDYIFMIGIGWQLPNNNNWNYVWQNMIEHNPHSAKTHTNTSFYVRLFFYLKCSGSNDSCKVWNTS